MAEEQSAEVPARAALRRWIDEDKQRSQSSLAQVIGVSQPSVSAWLTGSSRPEAHHREALEALTGIPADDWKTADERSLVLRMRARAEGGVGVQRTGTEG